MPRETSSIWKMFAPLIVVVVLAFAWSAYWFVAIGVAQQTVVEQRANFGGRGITLACSEESWGGYPFRFEFTCTKPLVSVEGIGQVTANKVLIMALAYNPKQLVVLSDGPATILKSGVTELALRHARVLASITFDGNWNPSLSMEIPQFEIPQLLTIRKLMVFTRPDPLNALGLAASFEALHWQRPKRPELLIDTGQLVGGLTPSFSLNVDEVSLSRENVRYWGSGQLSLDSLHRPSGKLETETNDLKGLLDILEPHFEMKDQEKANLRMILGLLGQQAKADLVFHEGEFFIGPYRISDLVPLY